MAGNRNTGLVIKVVQVVIRPAETRVGDPYVRSFPVEYGVSVELMPARPVRPLIIAQPLVILVAVYGPPAVETLLRPDSHQAAYLFAFFLPTEPSGKQILEIIIPKFFRKKIEILLRQAILRHIAHPRPTGANKADTWTRRSPL